MRQFRHRFTCPRLVLPWVHLADVSAKRTFLAVRSTTTTCSCGGPFRRSMNTVDKGSIGLERRHAASAVNSISFTNVGTSSMCAEHKDYAQHGEPSFTALEAPDECRHQEQQRVAVERVADFLSQGRVANCLRRMHTTSTNADFSDARCSLDVAVRLLLSDETRTRAAHVPGDTEEDVSLSPSTTVLDQLAFAVLNHRQRVWKAEAPLELVFPTLSPPAKRQSVTGRRKSATLAAGEKNNRCTKMQTFLAVGYGLSERCAVAAAAMHAERIIDDSGLHLYALPRMQERHALEVRSRGRWAPLPTEGPQHSTTKSDVGEQDPSRSSEHNEVPSLPTKSPLPQCVVVTQEPNDGKSEMSHRPTVVAASPHPSAGVLPRIPQHDHSPGGRRAASAASASTAASGRAFGYRIRTGRSLDFFSYSCNVELDGSISASSVVPPSSVELHGALNAPQSTGSLRDKPGAADDDPMFVPYGDEGGGGGASHAHHRYKCNGNGSEERAPSWDAVRAALGHRGTGGTTTSSEIHADDVKIMSPSLSFSSSSSSSSRSHSDTGVNTCAVNRRTHARLPDNLMHREKPFLPNRHVSTNVVDASEGGVYDLVEDGDAWVSENDAPLPYVCIRDPGALRRMTTACREASNAVMKMVGRTAVDKATCLLLTPGVVQQPQQPPDSTATGTDLLRSLMVLQPVDTIVDCTSTSSGGGGKVSRSAAHDYCTWYTAKISIDVLVTWLLLCQAATACQGAGGSPEHQRATTGTETNKRDKVAAMVRLLEEQEKRTRNAEGGNGGDKGQLRGDSSADLSDATSHRQKQPTLSLSSTETAPDGARWAPPTARLVAEGKGPTCAAAMELCAMHAERLLEQLGVPLFPANPAKSQIVDDACLRYGRSRGRLLFTSHEVAQWLEGAVLAVAHASVEDSLETSEGRQTTTTTREAAGLLDAVTRRLEARIQAEDNRLQKPLKLLYRNKDVNRPIPRFPHANDDVDAASPTFVEREHRATKPAAPSSSSSSSGSGGLTRGCPLSQQEVMLALHRRVIATNRIHGIELDVDHSWDLLLSAEAAVSAYMRRHTANVGAAELPILLARYSDAHFRASMFLPVPDPRYGIRGGYAVGLTPRSARALCALHALDVLCALGIPALSDSDEQRAMIEERRKRGLVVPAAAPARRGAGEAASYAAQPIVLSPPAYREVVGGSLSIPPASVTWSLLALDASEFDVCRDAPPLVATAAVANEQQHHETRNALAASYGSGLGELDALRRLVHALVFELAGWSPETLSRQTQVLVAAQHVGPQRRMAANNSWFELPLDSGHRSADRRRSGSEARPQRYVALGRCITKKGSERAMLIHALRIAAFLDLPELRYIVDGGSSARRSLRNMFEAFCSLHIHDSEGGGVNGNNPPLMAALRPSRSVDTGDTDGYPNPVMSTKLALETFKR